MSNKFSTSGPGGGWRVRTERAAGVGQQPNGSDSPHVWEGGTATDGGRNEGGGSEVVVQQRLHDEARPEQAQPEHGHHRRGKPRPPTVQGGSPASVAGWGTHLGPWNNVT